MINILSLTPDELVALMEKIGEPKYRAKQIFTQLHTGKCIDEMTNIGKVTKEKINAEVDISLPKIKRKMSTEVDMFLFYQKQ